MNKQEYLNNALLFFQKSYPQLNPAIRPNEFALDTDTGIVYLETPYTTSEINKFTNWEADLAKFYITASQLLETDSSDWDVIKEKILPQIKRLDQIKSINSQFPEEENLGLIYRPFIEDICIAWVIDQSSGFKYISEAEVKEWNKDIKDLEIIGIENLKKLPETIAGPRQISNGDGTFSLAWGSNDGYDASRILLSELHALLQQTFGPKYLIAIPHRDVLFATPIQLGDKLVKLTEQLFSKSSHPITSKILSFG